MATEVAHLRLIKDLRTLRQEDEAELRERFIRRFPRTAGTSDTCYVVYTRTGTDKPVIIDIAHGNKLGKLRLLDDLGYLYDIVEGADI